VIVVRLLGGLGNQLFQYATGRALAARRGDDLRLDASAYHEPQPGLTPRRYELDGWRIRAGLCDRWLLWKLRRGSRIPLLAPLLGGHAVVTEASHYFDASLERRTERHLYLDGYWQCERYFRDIRGELLSELALIAPPDARNAALLDEIRGCNAVAVHVRRTDYVQNEHLRAVHGACSVDYYRRAMAHVCERTDSPRFFLFSDDPKWVEANIEAPGPARYVSHNGGDRGAEDLRLMRECKRFVIANSSFSWWGAWLAVHADKIVVAPRPWFADPKEDEGDLVPDSWVRL
jgi:glycosyl transferase family 11